MSKLPYSQDEWQTIEQWGHAQWVLERNVRVIGFEFRDVNPFVNGIGPFILDLRLGNLSVIGHVSLNRVLKDNILHCLGEWPNCSGPEYGNVIKLCVTNDFKGTVRIITDEIPHLTDLVGRPI